MIERKNLKTIVYTLTFKKTLLALFASFSRAKKKFDKNQSLYLIFACVTLFVVQFLNQNQKNTGILTN